MWGSYGFLTSLPPNRYVAVIVDFTFLCPVIFMLQDFLCSCKSSWALFCDALKLLANSLVLLAVDFMT